MLRPHISTILPPTPPWISHTPQHNPRPQIQTPISLSKPLTIPLSTIPRSLSTIPKANYGRVLNSPLVLTLSSHHQSSITTLPLLPAYNNQQPTRLSQFLSSLPSSSSSTCNPKPQESSLPRFLEKNDGADPQDRKLHGSVLQRKMPRRTNKKGTTHSSFHLQRPMCNPKPAGVITSFSRECLSRPPRSKTQIEFFSEECLGEPTRKEQRIACLFNEKCLGEPTS